MENKNSQERMTPFMVLFVRVIFEDCIFQQIQDFLGYTDMFKFVSYTDTNNLLNVSIRFQTIKKAKYYWKLNKEYSLKYHDDEDFKIRLNSLLTRSERQLSLNLENCDGVHDISVLSNIHSLNLNSCRNLTTMSAPGKIHKLDLSNCNSITDVSALSGLHSLDLSGCQGITDVSALNNVHSLGLVGCNTVCDISALINVHILDIRECQKIRNISSVGNVFILDAEDSKDIKDVNVLGKNVYKLDVSDCYGIDDVSKFIMEYFLSTKQSSTRVHLFEIDELGKQIDGNMHIRICDARHLKKT
jgi:hypothetical protein